MLSPGPAEPAVFRYPQCLELFPPPHPNPLPGQLHSALKSRLKSPPHPTLLSWFHPAVCLPPGRLTLHLFYRGLVGR